MTFIPLTYKNFVVNKVKNTLEVSYKDSDINTHICNKNIQSRSLINTNSYRNLTNEECQIPTDDVNLLSKKQEIKNFYSNVSRENLTAVDYFSAKETINTASLNNDNIKDYNFRNYYKIDRIEQKFLPSSFELQKKNIVNNVLYNDYRSNYSLDFYKYLNKGFCNYNTINFFSQQYDTDTNHTNCIVWPNTKTSSGHLYDFLDSSFTFSCYINLRKNYGTEKQPECLLHIPDVLSVYTVKGIYKDFHRIAIVLGKSSKKKIKVHNPTIFNTSSKKVDSDTYISSDLNIVNNKWYNVCIDLSKNEDNSRYIELYIDGILFDSFKLDFVKDHATINNSYICLGNKPDYYNEDSLSYNNDYNKIFYQMFGSKFSDTNPVSGPFIVKDISLGNNTFWSDAGDYSIEDIVNQGEGILFEESKIKNSESFHGEIHDIRIYKQSLNKDKILVNCNNTIDSISKEKKDYNLAFYVPVFYLPLFTSKRSFVNSSNNKLNIHYSNIYNPYLANFCGGLEITSESYLLDFVNYTKPNVIVGGKLVSNIYDDKTNLSFNSMIDSTNDVGSIKRGMLAKSIYNQNLNNTDHENFSNSIHCNLSYKNLLVLPNDNGIPSVKFDIIEEVLLDLTHDSTNLDESYHINTNNIFSKSYYDNSLDVANLFIDDTGVEFNIKLNNTKNYEYKFCADMLYNTSNIIYHDNRIINMSDLSIINDEIFSDRLVNIKNILFLSNSNPVLRDYKQDTNSFNTNNLSYIKEIETYSNTNKIKYFKLPVTYSAINKDYDCIFNTIFDVSSKLYNKKINKNTFSISDSNIITTNSNINIKLSDDGYGSLYRDDCLTKIADWNYVGHIFYKEGIISINRPELSYFGENDFECTFSTDFSMFVHEINIPAESGTLNKTTNTTYDETLRHDQSAFNSESSFVYITDINLHDENLNIVARAKLARPAPKKNDDDILFKLKMDY
jgi:hypothetical protein